MPRLENLPQTRISFRRSANNLHIATGEDLDLEQARAILNLMRCHSNDCNKFFIDVRHVTRIQPAAAAHPLQRLPRLRAGDERQQGPHCP